VAWYVPVVAAAAMACFGMWGPARGSAMGNDEVVSRWAASLAVGQLARLLLRVDPVHGLYYLLLRNWMGGRHKPRGPAARPMLSHNRRNGTDSCHGGLVDGYHDRRISDI
jgi:hypothetical protein